MIFTPKSYTNRAEWIARGFGNDGTCFEVPMVPGSEEMITIEDRCIDEGASVAKSEGGLTRYAFADGSSIVVGDNGWDLGLGTECFCWAGVGHVGCGHPDAVTQ